MMWHAPTSMLSASPLWKELQQDPGEYLCISDKQGPLQFDGCDGMDGMCLANVSCRDFRQANALDQPFFDQPLRSNTTSLRMHS